MLSRRTDLVTLLNADGGGGGRLTRSVEDVSRAAYITADRISPEMGTAMISPRRIFKNAFKAQRVGEYRWASRFMAVHRADGNH
jgi:hypothetical protein